MNIYLRDNGGYVDGCGLRWSAPNPLGLRFQRQASNIEVQYLINLGYILFLNVRNGSHWVYGYSNTG